MMKSNIAGLAVLPVGSVCVNHIGQVGMIVDNAGNVLVLTREEAIDIGNALIRAAQAKAGDDLGPTLDTPKNLFKQ